LRNQSFLVNWIKLFCTRKQCFKVELEWFKWLGRNWWKRDRKCGNRSFTRENQKIFCCQSRTTLRVGGTDRVYRSHMVCMTMRAFQGPKMSLFRNFRVLMHLYESQTPKPLNFANELILKNEEKETNFANFEK